MDLKRQKIVLRDLSTDRKNENFYYHIRLEITLGTKLKYRKYPHLATPLGQNTCALRTRIRTDKIFFIITIYYL